MIYKFYYKEKYLNSERLMFDALNVKNDPIQTWKDHNEYNNFLNSDLLYYYEVQNGFKNLFERDVSVMIHGIIYTFKFEHVLIHHAKSISKDKNLTETLLKHTFPYFNSRLDVLDYAQNTMSWSDVRDFASKKIAAEHLTVDETWKQMKMVVEYVPSIFIH